MDATNHNIPTVRIDPEIKYADVVPLPKGLNSTHELISLLLCHNQVQCVSAVITTGIVANVGTNTARGIMDKEVVS